MSFITNLFSKGATDLVGAVGKVLDDVVTTKEEKIHLEYEMRKSEIEFQIEMKKLSIDEQRMVLEDISSARQREVAVQTSEHASKLSKNVAPYMALATVFITLLFFYILIFKPESITKDSRDIVLYILGVLSTILTQIYSYYFGSSAGSADKARTIASMKGEKT
jgi:uncharacterized membrane protein (DUF106 family)